MKQKLLLSTFFLFAAVITMKAEAGDTTTYDFRDGTIISNGQSDDGSLLLAGTYSYHSADYGLNMKSDAQIKIAVPGSCVVKFLGSAYSSLSMSGETIGGTPLDPAIQSTTVLNDRTDTYDFTYYGVEDTLVFTATESGSDVYLPVIEVILLPPPVVYDFRDGTIISNGQSDDGSLVLGGTYSYHSADYGLNMKSDATVTIVVPGSCIVRFLGSAYSSLSMSGETIDGTPLDPAVQSTTVANDRSDTYEFAYYGFEDTLVFTATESGSDVYLPLIQMIPLEPPVAYDFRDGTIISNGQSDDGSLVLGGTYSYHSADYGLNMKLDAEIHIAVPGSCIVRFLGSAYSSLSMGGTTKDGAPLDPAVQSTQVVNDRADTYQFAYDGDADTLVFTATGGGSDVYLPLIEVIPGAVKIKEWKQKSGDVIFNNDTIHIVSATAAGEVPEVTVSDGTVISVTDEVASVRMDLGGNALSSFAMEVTDSIASVTVNGDMLAVAFADSTYLPLGYMIQVADNSTVVEAEPGKTYTYNFFDGSVLPQESYQTLRYTTFISQDGILTLNSNTDEEAGQFGYHDASHGAVMFPGNSADIIVAGDAIVTFIVCTYGRAEDAVFEFTDGDSNVLGSSAAQNIGLEDAFASSFSYTGPAGTITATLKSEGWPTAEIYIHGLTIENAAEIVSTGKIDVWDFGAEQLDTAIYYNFLNEEVINGWYDPGITVGSTGNVLPSNWSAGAVSWVGGSNDRLRTSNTSLTRYDENLDGITGYKGRLYVNSAANTGRFLGLTLSEDDEITLIAKTQSGGNLVFEYVNDPESQTDQVHMTDALRELHFVAKQRGTYHIYDNEGKPSYYRIYRADATYAEISGSVDETEAPDIPSYELIFTNQAGKTWNAPVSSGAYSVSLPAGYSYDLTLAGANGYIISEGNSLEVSDTTTTHDIAVLKLELYTVSGAVTGLGAEISELSLVYTADPDAQRIFIPEPVVDAEASTYSVVLEPEVHYTISAEGVNDYFLPVDTIRIGHADESTDLVFEAKPVYNVSITAENLTAEQEAVLGLTFTNLLEEGYEYNFSTTGDIALRDGTYAVSYSGLDDYPVALGLTSNLVVDSADVSKTLVFQPVVDWTFDDREIANGTPSYKGLLFTGDVYNEVAKGHLAAKTGATIQVPVNPGEKVRVTFYYSADFTMEGDTFSTNSGSTGLMEYGEYVYEGAEAGYVTITMGDGASTSYFPNISVMEALAYQETITVGPDKDYLTINGALDAIASMDREEGQRVTVLIDPGDYEEMLVVTVPEITLKNASPTPSIALLNKGVDIDTNAVRITSYYGHGYNYYSMAPDQKWNADVLRVNKENGYLSYENKGAGTTNGSWWNATVVVSADGFQAEGIIFENSFNQYISQKESEDVIEMWESGSKGERPTDYGNTSVQDRSFVERAAGIAITNEVDKVILNKCRVVGRQDSFFGGRGSRVVVYKGAMMGAVDYIFGGMVAVFYKSELVMNVSDVSGDLSYLTAAQQSGGRGYLMYECVVTAPEPGVESASLYRAKPGYFGRPWEATTSEVVFYNTLVDTTDYPGSEGKSLILPLGWDNTLGGESSMMYEYGTTEFSGEDNSSSRAAWSTLLSTPVLTDGTDITTFNFTKGDDGWDPLPELIANDPATSVRLTGEEGIVRVYPNPTSGSVTILLDGMVTGSRIEVYNMLGKQVLSKAAESAQENLDLGQFGKGIYVLRIVREGSTATGRIVVR